MSGDYNTYYCLVLVENVALAGHYKSYPAVSTPCHKSTYLPVISS